MRSVYVEKRKLVKMSKNCTYILEAPEKLKKNDGQDSAMVLDKIELEVTEKMAVEQWKSFPARSLKIWIL